MCCTQRLLRGPQKHIKKIHIKSFLANLQNHKGKQEQTKIDGSFSFVLVPGFVGLRKKKKKVAKFGPPELGKRPFDTVFRD